MTNTNPWRAANNGSGKNKWFVCRDAVPGASMPLEYLDGANGRLVRFASREAAQKRADGLNAEITVWVKSTSHRSRQRLHSACASAGLDKPQAWFRTRNGSIMNRTDDEYFEVPANLDLSRIKGLVTLKHALSVHERFKPISFR